MKNYHVLLIAFLWIPMSIIAQKAKKGALNNLDANSSEFAKIALQIWDWAEMGYQEEKSAALLQETLKNEGFEITTGIAEIPTAFMAEY